MADAYRGGGGGDKPGFNAFGMSVEEQAQQLVDLRKEKNKLNDENEKLRREMLRLEKQVWAHKLTKGNVATGK